MIEYYQTWDMEETAMVFDAMLRHLQGEFSEAKAVVTISDALRTRARNQGRVFNEQFRNRNSVRIKMTQLEYLYTNGEKGLDPKGSKPKLREIIDMYQNAPEEYQTLLTNAKKSIFAYAPKEMPKEMMIGADAAECEKKLVDQFKNWLFTVKKEDARNVIHLIRDIMTCDTIAHKKGLYQENLLDSCDAEKVDALIQILCRQGIGKSGRNAGRLKQALHYYAEFCHGSDFPDTLTA